jgi:hypothetical protein
MAVSTIAEHKSEEDVTVLVGHHGAGGPVGEVAVPRAAGGALPAGIDHGGRVVAAKDGLLSLPRAGTVDERGYLPKELAFKAIGTAQGDMASMKQRCLDVITRIMREHQAASQKQKNWFEAVVASIRERGSQHVAQLKAKLVEARRGQVKSEQRAEAEKAISERQVREAREEAIAATAAAERQVAAEKEMAAAAIAEARAAARTEAEQAAQEAEQAVQEANAARARDVKATEAAWKGKLSSAIASAEAHEDTVTALEGQLLEAGTKYREVQTQLTETEARAEAAEAAGGSDARSAAEAASALAQAQEAARSAQQEAESSAAQVSRLQEELAVVQASPGNSRVEESESAAGSAAGAAVEDGTGLGADPAEVARLQAELAEARAETARWREAAETAQAKAAGATAGASDDDARAGRLAELEALVAEAEAAMKDAEEKAAESKASAADKAAMHKEAKAAVRVWQEEFEAEHGEKPDVEAKRSVKELYQAYSDAAGASKSAAAGAEEKSEEAAEARRRWERLVEELQRTAGDGSSSSPKIGASPAVPSGGGSAESTAVTLALRARISQLEQELDRAKRHVSEAKAAALAGVGDEKPSSDGADVDEDDDSSEVHARELATARAEAAAESEEAMRGLRREKEDAQRIAQRAERQLAAAEARAEALEGDLALAQAEAEAAQLQARIATGTAASAASAAPVPASGGDAGSGGEGSCGADLEVLRAETKEAVGSAKELWGAKKKRECLETLSQQAERLEAELSLGEAGAGAEGLAVRTELRSGIVEARAGAEGQAVSKQALSLRQGLDRFLKDVDAAMPRLSRAKAAGAAAASDTTASAAASAGGSAGGGGGDGSGELVRLLKEQLAKAKAEAASQRAEATKARADADEAAVAASQARDEAQEAIAEAKVELAEAQQAVAEAEAAAEAAEAAAPAGDAAAADGPSSSGKSGGGRVPAKSAGGASSREVAALKKKVASGEKEVANLKTQLSEARKEAKVAREEAAQAESAAKKASTRIAAAAPSKAEAKKEADKAKREKKALDDLRARAKKAESERDGLAKQLSDAEKAVASAERRGQGEAEKIAAELAAAEKTAKRESTKLTKDLGAAVKRGDELEAERDALKQERNELKTQVAKVGELGKEVEELRVEAARAKEMEAEMAEARASVDDMSTKYKKEVILRKQYWNMMEDMKGKVRVYCRTRPMSGSEKERGCTSVVNFPDTFTIDVTTEKGDKSFVFDQCFGPASTQEEVFADTERLIQSAFDGFNVCIFAYGQTGSGKTWTMSGSPEMPGITARAISKLFALIDESAGNCTATVSAHMVEIYNDQLRDLLFRARNSKNKKALAAPPKLDIKVDKKGWVHIKNAHVDKAAGVAELLDIFDAGNGARAVGSTKMNSESSRSHSVFSIMLEIYNRTTKKTTRGKLSLVDLAGSERAGKTGATADRLREAQSINKSLSALGNVISALSSGEKHIPYRDNLLTRLMQDSLGGTAKTLMFCCCSPADYNDEETISTLVYAARVKLITNTAKKEEDSAEVTRLKRIIKRLKAGDAAEEEEDGDAAAAASAAASGDGSG